MTCGLVHASHSLPKWQAIKLTFFKPCLTPVSNVCEVSNICKAVPISLFWALRGLNELPEVHFEFPFNLIGKLTMAFLTGQSWHILKGQGFQCCFADGLNQKLTSVCGAGYENFRLFLSKLAASYSPGYLLFGYFSSLVTFFSLFLFSCKLLCCYN